MRRCTLEIFRFSVIKTRFPFFLNQPDIIFRWNSSFSFYHCWILFPFLFRLEHEDVTICWWVSTFSGISRTNITDIPLFLFDLEWKYFRLTLACSRLHLNFPKRSEITFQYPCMLSLSFPSARRKNIEKYDGNLWTLVWLHLAVSRTCQQSSYLNIYYESNRSHRCMREGRKIEFQGKARTSWCFPSFFVLFLLENDEKFTASVKKLFSEKNFKSHMTISFHFWHELVSIFCENELSKHCQWISKPKFHPFEENPLLVASEKLLED